LPRLVSAVVNSMLEANITVVSQRDDGEDCYRFFSALSMGTMITTDFMHGVPAGSINGTWIEVVSTPAKITSHCWSTISRVASNDCV
jgi:hypothetical protein